MVPGIEQRVNPPPIEGLIPCRPNEGILLATSDTMSPLPGASLALSEAVTTNRQQGQAEEGENFDNRLYHDVNTLSCSVRESRYVKSKTVIPDRNRDTVNGLLDGYAECI
ncbi:MAG: hypothetical protein OXG30_04735 [bacterium]|nr:hypothetical protein [bacterium]